MRSFRREPKFRLWTGMDKTELGDNMKLKLVVRAKDRLLAAQGGKRTKGVVRLEKEIAKLRPMAESEMKYAMRKGL